MLGGIYYGARSRELGMTELTWNSISWHIIAKWSLWKLIWWLCSVARGRTDSSENFSWLGIHSICFRPVNYIFKYGILPELLGKYYLKLLSKNQINNAWEASHENELSITSKHIFSKSGGKLRSLVLFSDRSVIGNDPMWKWAVYNWMVSHLLSQNYLYSKG